MLSTGHTGGLWDNEGKGLNLKPLTRVSTAVLLACQEEAPDAQRMLCDDQHGQHEQRVQLEVRAVDGRVEAVRLDEVDARHQQHHQRQLRSIGGKASIKTHPLSGLAALRLDRPYTLMKWMPVTSSTGGTTSASCAA